MARKSKYEPQKLSTVLWKPALYIRLSREDGDKEESNSITGQRELLRDFIRTRPELREYAVRFALVQRLDYLLHIPVGRMVDTDAFYKSVKQYLRGHFSDTRKNPLLDKKSRTYLTLLTIAPKTVRRVHGWTMKLRGVG